ncbi:MAG: FAD-dependent oxidoreductase, partial [bacterium]
METSDVLIIGGGIVGLAAAHRLLQHRPDTSLTLLEKEDALARHQTGHNSGVIHSGIYYRPGSLKARTCRRGKAALERFCEEEGIAFDRCGKVIVAVEEEEADRLEDLCERGRANGVACRLIGPGELAEIEPHAAGVKAIHVP